MSRTPHPTDEPTLIPADAELAERVDRLARAKGRDPAAVLNDLATHGLHHAEDALDA